MSAEEIRESDYEGINFHGLLPPNNDKQYQELVPITGNNGFNPQQNQIDWEFPPFVDELILMDIASENECYGTGSEEMLEGTPGNNQGDAPSLPMLPPENNQPLVSQFERVFKEHVEVPVQNNRRPAGSNSLETRERNREYRAACNARAEDQQIQLEQKIALLNEEVVARNNENTEKVNFISGIKHGALLPVVNARREAIKVSLETEKRNNDSYQLAVSDCATNQRELNYATYRYANKKLFNVPSGTLASQKNRAREKLESNQKKLASLDLDYKIRFQTQLSPFLDDVWYTFNVPFVSMPVLWDKILHFSGWYGLNECLDAAWVILQQHPDG